MVLFKINYGFCFERPVSFNLPVLLNQKQKVCALHQKERRDYMRLTFWLLVEFSELILFFAVMQKEKKQMF